MSLLHTMSSLHISYSVIAYLCNLSFPCLINPPARGTQSPRPAVSKTEKWVHVLLSYIYWNISKKQLINFLHVICKIIVSFTLSHLWKFFQMFYSTLSGKVTCEIFTSAVYKFGRCLNFYQACILYSFSFDLSSL